MIPGINFQFKRPSTNKQFREFIFIGNTAGNYVSNETNKLHGAAGNTISQATVEDSLKITEIETSREIAHQLKNLQIKIGAIVKLINKTKNGSVIVSHDNKLIGMGAEIAHQIVATRVN